MVQLPPNSSELLKVVWLIGSVSTRWELTAFLQTPIAYFEGGETKTEGTGDERGAD
jgi:hypothetical protein